MKSAHRHQLETNILAQRLEMAIERFRPYASTAAGVLIAAIVLFLIWSYVSKSSVARQGEAWNSFHQAVGSVPPNLNALHQFAQEYPDTPMQQLADLTWADGQVYFASENFIYNRAAAMEALDRATSAYQSVLQTSDDERSANRARLGLARIYEMRNDLEKARQEYLKVGGGFAEYAELQAKQLAEPETQDMYAWLAKAEPPRQQAPRGPGRPGQRPEFEVGDLSLPGDEAVKDGAPGSEAPASAESFEELLRGLQLPTSDRGGRYEGGLLGQPPSEAAPESEAGTKAPATEEPATEEPATEEPATEEPATEEPASEEPASEEPASEEPASEEPASEAPATEAPESEAPESEETPAE